MLSPAAAQDLNQAIGRDMPSLMALYRDLHANPELSMQETRSAARMAAEARRAGFTVTTGVGGTGVVAVLENGPGPGAAAARRHGRASGRGARPACPSPAGRAARPARGSRPASCTPAATTPI